MSLFTHHSIDDANQAGSPSSKSRLQLCKQLSVLNAHPIKPYHTSITDLIQWLQSSTQQSKSSLVFMNEQLLKGLTPTASLALIVEEAVTNEGVGSNSNSSSKDINNHQSMFYGDSKWIQSALSNNNEPKDVTNNKSIHRRFESILLHEISELASHNLRRSHDSTVSSSSSTTTMAEDVDLHTISTCIQRVYTRSCFDWSGMEADMASRALNKFQACWTQSMKSETEECSKFVTSCNMQLMEITAQLAKADLSSSNNNKSKLRKVKTQIEDEISTIKSLENQLALEISRLNQTKRLKRLLDVHMNIERYSPISALTEEIRNAVTYGPTVTASASDFTFSVLDGAAEIVIKIALDGDSSEGEESSMSMSCCKNNSSSSPPTTEVGCFIKDGGASIQLLQAFLLGNLQSSTSDENLVFGPYPLHDSLSKMILENESREELFLQTSHVISRIDTLVRSVREIETSGQGFCTVNATPSGDVTLSVSASLDGHNEDTVVQITFLFGNLLGDDWCVTTIPNNIKVSIVSSSVEKNQDYSSIKNELQEKAQAILLSGSLDPLLLRRICGLVISNS